MHHNYLNKLEYTTILNTLISYATTYLGQEFCKNLLPSSSKETVRIWLEETSEAVRLLMQKKNPPFRTITDITFSLRVLDVQGYLPAIQLLQIGQLLKMSGLLKEYYEQDSQNNETTFPRLEEYFSQLYRNPSIENTLLISISEDGKLTDEASKELRNIRRRQRALEEKIKEKLDSFLHSSTYSKYIQESIVTIRNNRYVIPVKEEYRTQIKGFIHDFSASGSTVFIEPMVVFDMNNEISTLKAEEAKEVERILHELSILLYPIVAELRQSLTQIGTLDFIFAKAKYAICLQAIEPIITDQKCIHLLGARHPLIDPNFVVPIDLSLGDTFSTLVITGPNTGGKTVTLKTVGLLTLMACSGLHIPVKEQSRLFVFDTVFADIGDEQSIQESLSTFSSHMRNIIDILAVATPSSLILLDELGSGTDPIEGSSLAISILEALHQKHILTLSTTHYPEIKNYALVTEGFENASCEFDVENLRPTYRLLIGIPGKSNAFAISKKLGLNTSILERASSLLTNESVNIEELLKNIYDHKISIEKEKEEIEKNKVQIENLRKSLEQKNNTVKEKEMQLIEKAKQQARDILLKAKEEANDTIRELSRLYDGANSSTLKEMNQIRNTLNASIKETISEKEAQSLNTSLLPEELTMDMEIFVPSFNQYGTILSLPSKANQVQVQLGNAKIMLPIASLVKTNSSNTKKEVSHTSFKTAKTKQITTEINVIGSTVEEALFVLDKYLDDVMLAKLTTISIVHGKGTGILRKGIHDFLKKHPHVKSYRLGTFGEGEMGVTIVELK